MTELYINPLILEVIPIELKAQSPLEIDVLGRGLDTSFDIQTSRTSMITPTKKKIITMSAHVPPLSNTIVDAPWELEAIDIPKGDDP